MTPCSLWRGIVLGGVLLCSACAKPNPATYLEVQHPFGLNWEPSPEEQEHLIAVHDQYCTDTWVNPETRFGSVARPEMAEFCLTETPAQVFLTQHELPPELADGELSTVLGEDTVPLAVEYTYLHQVYPHTTKHDERLRLERADHLGKLLEDQYGPADMAGTYMENMPTGFMPGPISISPCRIWLEGDILVLLCSERIVLIDGVEMSLSYIHTDRSEFGKSLATLVSSGAFPPAESP